ncbi:neuroglobin-like [Microplitis mediator]|uniref:neuroglobin-like n=1 Tax=Microplitis mediator TaxID=375433 RepID=UPI00255425AB|nr:neuroglobin-like [Microplitis mediator]XP_057329730.1 neuroglobin-like [Microplitis mediator]
MQAKFLFIIYIGILSTTLICAADANCDTSSCPSTQQTSFFNDNACYIDSQELTADDIKRVQNIWDLLFSNPLETAIGIISRASDIYPEFRQFVLDFYNLASAEDIPKDKRCQRQALRVVSTVNIFIKSIPYVNTVEDFLFYVGKRHQKLGVRQNDFIAFRKALFYVMGRKLDQLGYPFSQEDDIAWNKALDILLKPMIKGYKS